MKTTTDSTINCYITTPLYYINDKPHLGTAYSTVLADVIHRYHQILGGESFFLTGTDEHGQKCHQSAKEQKTPVQEYCNKMSDNFIKVWKSLDISYNFFFRTTATWHKGAVQKSLQELYDKQLIYESTYEGWYCQSEEIFYTSKDLINGKSPSGREVMRIKEKNYFFKMSAYQSRLIEYIQKKPDFIQPIYRKNEVLGFLKKPLEDLCISRPKSRLSWGIEVPFNPNYVTYVWVDALLNYATGVGYQQPTTPPHPHYGPKDFKNWWQDIGATHIIGKDILITHCVYWTCLLMALEQKLPRTILAHGWLLNPSQEKMSKSKGSVMDPLALLKSFDSDSLRYFLIRDIPVGNDAPVSHELITRRINEDLANNLGNLLSRTTKILHQHFESRIPKETICPQNLKEKKQQALKSIPKNLLKPHLILEDVIDLLNETNRFLEKEAPWKLVKKDQKHKAAEVLRTALDILAFSAVLLQPVMPQKMKVLLQALGNSKNSNIANKLQPLKEGEKIQEISALFPRIKT